MSTEMKNIVYTPAELEAPEFLAHVMYALLNAENKEKINLLIEQLIAEQS